MNQPFREIHTPEDALYLFIFFTNHISCFSGPTLMDFPKSLLVLLLHLANFTTTQGTRPYLLSNSEALWLA